MPVHLTRPAAAVALALSVGLLALPACKKKRAPTAAEPPAPSGGPNAPAPNSTARAWDAPARPVFASAFEAPMRVAAENNVKQILSAMHSYHDQHGTLPGGYADATGKPGLSWRVAILPYLEHGPLFKQFKLDEPWDSEANKKLIAQMPATFAPPRAQTNGYTFLRGFSGPHTWLPPARGPVKPGQPLAGVGLTQFPDGASNTIVVAEAYDPVIWTKPDELAFTPGTAPKLGGVFSSGAVVGLADGSARFLRNGTDPKTLANAIQTDDGNVANLDW